MASRIFLPRDYAERNRPLVDQPVRESAKDAARTTEPIRNWIAPHPVLHEFPKSGKLDLPFVLTRLSVARTALAKVSQYARDLEARITIVAPQVVPYPLPLEEPPVQTAILEQVLSGLAAEQPAETAVEIYLCRDPWETIKQVLRPESVVMIAARKRWWWPSSEARLGAFLRRAGHRVVYV